MEAKKINIKSLKYRGGNTIVRYTITCDCGCAEKAYAVAYPSDKILTEKQVKDNIIAESQRGSKLKTRQEKLAESAKIIAESNKSDELEDKG